MTQIHIQNRCFLLALLIASQAACLGFGVAWATGWLWQAFEGVVHNYVTAQGRAETHQLALEIQSFGLTTIEPGTDDWQRLQKLCENTQVPHEGFVCIMRRDNGAMLCHPNLKQDPGLQRLFPGRGLLINDQTSGPILQLIKNVESDRLPAVLGKVDLDGQVHAFTGYSLPSLNAILGVYQSDMAIDNFIAATIRPVMQVGYILMVFVIGATAMITGFLLNRYEAGLAAANARLETQVEERTRSLVRTRNAVTFGLAKLAESRDKDTGKHLERIRTYVSILATEIARIYPEIDRNFVADLAVASSLHDIGKVGIPDTILLKPARLNPQERKAMEMHTTLGSECLGAIRKQLEEDDFLEVAEQIAASHHEHWDGSGYPKGLQGKDIPLAGRIVALADVYDALTSHRPYKAAVPHAEARDWIVSRYAQQFDPMIVEAFVAREKDFFRISTDREDMARLCEVEAEFSKDINAPVVDVDSAILAGVG
jgi:response regulator RpfG family c-di-GMP phosphodiesterase